MLWERFFRGSISAVAVTGSMPWCSFRDALSPCIEDYQFPKGGRSIYRIYGPTPVCKDNFVWQPGVRLHAYIRPVMWRTRGLPALMDSALFLLNSFTTCDGLCDKQDLEEPV